MIGLITGMILLSSTLTLGQGLVTRTVDPQREWSVLVLLALGWSVAFACGRRRREFARKFPDPPTSKGLLVLALRHAAQVRRADARSLAMAGLCGTGFLVVATEQLTQTGDLSRQQAPQFILLAAGMMLSVSLCAAWCSAAGSCRPP